MNLKILELGFVDSYELQEILLRSADTLQELHLSSLSGIGMLDLRNSCPNLETVIIHEQDYSMDQDWRGMPIFITPDRMSKAIINYPEARIASRLVSFEDPITFQNADLYLGGCANGDLHQLGRILLARSCSLYVGHRCHLKQDADAFEADLKAIAVQAGRSQALFFGERQEPYWSLGSDGKARSASRFSGTGNNKEVW
ncbi:MAG: hypothetical protein CYPHOPRED_002280 [Cyphobasidiales sp. Tagirdzhanova-0007]|nr:MAG: hypothetical protein CYPHOPRED_002280 [Cyphobasidiales sp. Tagirdzhanova-0007]